MSFEDLLKSTGDNDNQNISSQDKALQPETPSNTELQVTKRTVDLTKFNPQEVQKLNSIKNSLDFNQSSSISYFGAEVQKDIAKFADGIFENVKTKDTGAIGDNLAGLMLTIKGVDVDKLQEKDSFLDKIPLIKSFTKSMRSTAIKLENVSDTVDKIVVSLDTARQGLVRDVNALDALYDKNLQYLNNLEISIAAGDMKYNELTETVLLELKQKAEKTQDMLDIQKYNDFGQMLNELDKRIHDLKLSREIALQTLPQIRIIQGNDKILANKIQASVLTTIPIWKNQIALAISLHRQKTALDLQKKVTETTENMLRQNAELLKMNSIEIAKESERGIISIETLKDTHQKLLETIEESMKIYSEGKQKRSQVEKELSDMENNQKQKLLTLRNKT